MIQLEPGEGQNTVRGTFRVMTYAAITEWVSGHGPIGKDRGPFLRGQDPNPPAERSTVS